MPRSDARGTCSPALAALLLLAIPAAAQTCPAPLDDARRLVLVLGADR